jgi:hypothetical protein
VNLRKSDRGEMTTGFVAHIGEYLRGSGELSPAVREELGAVLIGAAEVLATRPTASLIAGLADDAERRLNDEDEYDRQQILEDLITALRKLS